MMLSDNIKKYRKKNNMSQEELAQKLDVSRQSVSLWENGQSQPTIDNIIALTKIFGVSSDELLSNATGFKEDVVPKEEIANNNNVDKKPRIIGKIIAIAAILGMVLIIILCIVQSRKSENPKDISSDTENQGTVQPQESENPQDTSPDTENQNTVQPQESENPQDTSPDTENQNTVQPQESENPQDTSLDTENQNTVQPQESENPQDTSLDTENQNTVQPQESTEQDLFNYCKDFAIKNGNLNGDYCIYQQPATLYGGYDNEYFSISYWGDSNMVEFCLHCPLSDTQSINFYLRMRGGYDGKYEYLSSKYYRSDGSSIRSASGYIYPSEFTNRYPLNCDSYIGSSDGQTEFMEESRVGICDLIECLKEFVSVEDMECDFSDFEFINF